MIKSPFLIAIDPGASGGVATYRDGIVDAWSMDKPDALKIWLDPEDEPFAYIEKVSGYIQPPKKPKPGEEAPTGHDAFRLENMSHRMFAFGKSVGIAIGAMKALGIPVAEVASATWQKPLFLKRNDAGRQEWKRNLRDKAQELFPNLKVTLVTADALLILNYAMLINQGKINCYEGNG